MIFECMWRQDKEKRERVGATNAKVEISLDSELGNQSHISFLPLRCDLGQST